jgi:hypothetical protein
MTLGNMRRQGVQHLIVSASPKQGRATHSQKKPRPGAPRLSFARPDEGHGRAKFSNFYPVLIATMLASVSTELEI